MAGLLRCQLFLSIFILFLSLWKTSLTNSSTIQRYSPFPSSTTEVIITYLPLWALICLGMYALSCVLYKVVTFEDCAGASLELGREIEIAKEKLKSRGFEFWKKWGVLNMRWITERAFLPDFLRCKIQCVLPSRTMGGLFVIVQSENKKYTWTTCIILPSWWDFEKQDNQTQTTYYQSCLCSCIFCKVYWAIIDQKSVLKQFF